MLAGRPQKVRHVDRERASEIATTRKVPVELELEKIRRRTVQKHIPESLGSIGLKIKG